MTSTLFESHRTPLPNPPPKRCKSLANPWFQPFRASRSVRSSCSRKHWDHGWRLSVRSSAIWPSPRIPQATNRRLGRWIGFVVFVVHARFQSDTATGFRCRGPVEPPPQWQSWLRFELARDSEGFQISRGGRLTIAGSMPNCFERLVQSVCRLFNDKYLEIERRKR